MMGNMLNVCCVSFEHKIWERERERERVWRRISDGRIKMQSGDAILWLS